MDWWGQAAAAMQALLDRYGVLAIALFVMVEEAGVPIPIPGDAAMLLAGVRVHAGQSSLAVVVGSLELATVVGASILYAIAHHVGRIAVYHYGRFLHLSPERLNRAEGWLQHRGMLAVVLGRLVPGLRILTAIACGVFGIRYRVFLPGMALGAFIYILAVVLLGYVLGPLALTLLNNVHLPLELLGSFVPLLVLLVWLVRARRELAVEARAPAGVGPLVVERGVRLRGGAAAGAIAALGAALTFNFLAQVAASLLPLTADPLAREVTARLPPEFAAGAFLSLVLDLTIFVVVGTGWGAVYAATADRLPLFPSWRIPDSSHGALFAIVPLAATLLFEARGLALGQSLGLLAAMGILAVQGVRYLLYGALLGMTCPIFLGAPSEELAGLNAGVHQRSS